jgi:hypothetical protein
MKTCKVEDCGGKVRARGLCGKHYMRVWYVEHPGELEKARNRMRKVPREVMRDRRYQYLYGIDSAWYAAQLVKQNGVCAICGKPENKTINGKLLKLAVDHCHDTGKVRGLLCQACNRGIGCFSHDIGILDKAKLFLSQPTDS